MKNQNFCKILFPPLGLIFTTAQAFYRNIDFLLKIDLSIFRTIIYMKKSKFIEKNIFTTNENLTKIHVSIIFRLII